MGSGINDGRCQMKKILLPLCVLILLLILCVYAPNTSIIAVTSPRTMPRPREILTAQPRLNRSYSDQIWDTTNSSNNSITNATQSSRVLDGEGFNRTIDDAGEFMENDGRSEERLKTSFQLDAEDGVSASAIISIPGIKKKLDLLGYDIQNSREIKELLTLFENVSNKLNVSKEEMQSTKSIETKNGSKSIHITPKQVLYTQEILPTTSDKCDPINQIIFIKTHKTGSTTMASIFERYGYRRNLMFALPRSKHIFPTTYFSRKDAIPIPQILAKKHPHYNILTNHAVYNRKEMDKLITNATYITILRDPVSQLESAFGYFEMSKGMGLSEEPNPFETFMQNPFHYYYHTNYTMKLRSRNGQLYDLGLPGKELNDTDAIKAKIDTLDREFDLVLITEYFDESLILMKKLLCWSFDDILYISNGIRSKNHRFTLSDDLGKRIRQWNAGDVLLYNHFNRTLWQQIQEYGPNFQTDLEYFRKLESEVLDRCIDSNKTDTKDRREDKYVLNPKHSGKYCQDLLRADVEYTTLLKEKMGIVVKKHVDQAKRTSMKKTLPVRRKRPVKQRSRIKRGR